MLFPLERLREGAGLHQGGVQIEVMRHDRGPEHADGHIQAVREHLLIGRIETGDQAADDLRPVRPGQADFNDEADGDNADERQSHQLQQPHATALDGQEYEGIGRGNRQPPDVRQPEEQLERDDRADHFRQIAGGDGNFAQNPQRNHHRAGILLPACLGQVSAGHDAQTRRQALQEQGHDVGKKKDPQEAIAEARSRLEVGSPVARVHVADAYEESRPGESQEPPPARTMRNRHRAVDVLQRVRLGYGS